MTWWWSVPLSITAVAASVAHIGARSLRREREALRAAAALLRTQVAATSAGEPRSRHLFGSARTVEPTHNR